jgi:diguanylate cyclase (GGDEF)-like protein
MNKNNQNNKRFTALRNALERSSLFRGIDFDAVEYLLLDCQVLNLKEGEVLLSKNQRNDNVYVILSGSFSINLIQPNDLAITSFGEGECLGEMSVIDGRDTSASVIAITDSSILQIPQDILWSMFNNSRGMAQNLLNILSQRIRIDDEIIVENFYARREIEQTAQSDSLTSLHNRRWFDDALARQIMRCNQDGTPFCLLILDLDYFKRINDTYGHIAGDRTLVAVARVLDSQLRPTDMLARYGGEEFALGLPNTKLDESFAIAERLRRAIEFLALPFRSGEPLPHVTISIGIAQMQPGQTPEALYAVADAALYRAKDGGRNRVVI